MYSIVGTVFLVLSHLSAAITGYCVSQNGDKEADDGAIIFFTASILLAAIGVALVK